MKQIYNFSQYEPPVLTQSMLKDIDEKRKMTLQTICLFAVGILFQLTVLLFGTMVGASYPLVGILCMAYVLLSMAGNGIAAAVYVRKGGIEQ